MTRDLPLEPIWLKADCRSVPETVTVSESEAQRPWSWEKQTEGPRPAQSESSEQGEHLLSELQTGLAFEEQLELVRHSTHGPAAEQTGLPGTERQALDAAMAQGTQVPDGEQKGVLPEQFESESH